MQAAGHRQQRSNVECSEWFVGVVAVDGHTVTNKHRRYTEIFLTTSIDLLEKATTSQGSTTFRLGFDPVVALSLTEPIRQSRLTNGGSLSGEVPDGTEIYCDSESDTDEHHRYAFRGYEPPPTARQPRVRIPDVGRLSDRRLAGIVDEFVLTSQGEAAFARSIPALAPTDWISRSSAAVPNDMSLEVARAVRDGRTSGLEVAKRMEQYRRAAQETNKSTTQSVQPAWMAKVDDERRKQEVARKRGRNSNTAATSSGGSSSGNTAAQTGRSSSRDPLDPLDDEIEEEDADEQQDLEPPETPVQNYYVFGEDGGDKDEGKDDQGYNDATAAKVRRGGRRPRDESLFESRVDDVGEALMRNKRVSRQVSMLRIMSTQNAPQSSTAPNDAIEDAVSHRVQVREPCVRFERSLVCFAGKANYLDARRIGLRVGSRRGLVARYRELERLATENSISFGFDPTSVLGQLETLKHTRVCVDSNSGLTWRVPAANAEQLQTIAINTN